MTPSQSDRREVLRSGLLWGLLSGAAGLLVLWSLSGTAVHAAPSLPMLEEPVAADGATVFQAECARCHGPSGEGAIEGPSLRGLPAGDATVAAVTALVRDGSYTMDGFGDELPAADISAVAEYVVAEFATIGDVARGGELYRLNCAGCHGASAHGGALIYSTENAPSLQDITSADAVAAMRSGPGTMPAYNQAALSDESTASIATYVDTLQNPPSPGGIAIPPAGPVTEGLVAGLIGLGAALIAAAWLTRGGRG